jgi:hypothetical protein
MNTLFGGEKVAKINHVIGNKLGKKYTYPAVKNTKECCSIVVWELLM